MSACDKLQHKLIKHTQKSDVNTFNNKIDEILDSIKLHKKVLALAHAQSREAFSVINGIFTEIVNKARVVIERLNRSIPFL